MFSLNSTVAYRSFDSIWMHMFIRLSQKIQHGRFGHCSCRKLHVHLVGCPQNSSFRQLVGKWKIGRRCKTTLMSLSYIQLKKKPQINRRKSLWNCRGKYISIITYFQWRWLSQIVVQQGFSWSTHTEPTNMPILWI